ncbi:hypothetical protein C943_03286 [Mariniradius saccharolyticus AK6]|uniref:Uncharacterized protein n=1 Tax=Mariniradius saccharolyticus AK6 TaxID=1239962 RepID=M7XID9_9BACT|nr:hypothetical protein [Mariniradius saccharolyticus]EMS34599.1 hypothetical protein C943_03286 [Mariniradius saccharolyticus AK6]
MDSKINSICKVEFARLGEISDYQESPNGTVLVTAAWQVLPIARPPRLSVSESLTKGGRVFESNFSAQLNYKVMNKDLLIVRISFSDGGQPLIIGNRDLPVRFQESHELAAKTLTFSHSSWHYPYREADI